MDPSLFFNLSKSKSITVPQVELLLTFEEFCSEEGVFEGQGEKGSAFAEIFVQV
jgi:hypothetical protein